MSASVEAPETTRGAETGPPSAVVPKRKIEEPRLGPLPEPNLLDRLRASWSVAALVPAFDVRNLKKREWRSAALLAVVAHAFAIAGIIVIGKLALATFVDKPQTIIHLSPVDRPVDDPTTPETERGGDPEEGPRATNPDGGGGGAPGVKPATGGPPPAMTPKPLIPPSITPPVVSTSMVLPPAVEGPERPALDPTAVPGITDVPPDPGDPSIGRNGEGGVGNNLGPGVGPGGAPGTGGGVKGGPGGPGTDPTAQRPGATGPGTGTGPGPGLGGRVKDRGPSFAYKAKPALTKAMIEAGTFGTVTIRVTISATGQLLSAEPVQTLQNGGTAAAMEALRRCRFLPAIRGGQYVDASTLVRFDIRSN